MSDPVELARTMVAAHLSDQQLIAQATHALTGEEVVEEGALDHLAWVDEDDPDPANGEPLTDLAAADEITARLAADYRLRAIARIERARWLEDQAHREAIASANARHRARMAQYDRDRAWFEGPLLELAKVLIPVGSKVKTIVTPFGGELKLTVPTKPKPVIVDEGEFLAWAMTSAPQLVRVEVAKAEVNAALAPKVIPVGDGGNPEEVATFDGEVVPGVTFETPAPRWSITVPKVTR